MRSWWWLVVTAAGWGVMLAAYVTRARPDPNAPWAHAILVVGPDLLADVAQIGQATKVSVRLLAANDRSEGIIRGVSLVRTDLALKLALELRPKLFLMPSEGAKIDASSLHSGRLPEPGRDEILAGATAAHHDRLTAGDRELEVVGVLKPGTGPLENSYVIPASEQANALFSDLDPSVRAATLLQLTTDQLHDRKLAAKLQKLLLASTYTLVMPLDRLDPQASYLYLGGLAAFLLGGSGALIGLFRWLAARARRELEKRDTEEVVEPGEAGASKPRVRWWAAPLIEMAQRPRLVWGVHLVYFGLVITGSLLAFRLPEVQTILLSKAHEALGSPLGPLAPVARAYESGNIVYAAAVTFVVNFFLGSLLVLTLPSVIVPGSGILMAALRSLVWGLIFAPMIGELAYAMLPHAGTMLLEGEGYILATLFGLLIPIHLCQSSLGGTPLSRFGRVLWLNLLGNFWVALVLIVAACYEATEVILMSR